MTTQRVVKWRPGWNERDFFGAVLAAGGLAPESVTLLEIAHDAGCPKVAGGACKCNPEVTAAIHPATGAP